MSESLIGHAAWIKSVTVASFCNIPPSVLSTLPILHLRIFEAYSSLEVPSNSSPGPNCTARALQKAGGDIHDDVNVSRNICGSQQESPQRLHR